MQTDRLTAIVSPPLQKEKKNSMSFGMKSTYCAPCVFLICVATWCNKS